MVTGWKSRIINRSRTFSFNTESTTRLQLHDRFAYYDFKKPVITHLIAQLVPMTRITRSMRATGCDQALQSELATRADPVNHVKKASGKKREVVEEVKNA